MGVVVFALVFVFVTKSLRIVRNRATRNAVTSAQTDDHPCACFPSYGTIFLGARAFRKKTLLDVTSHQNFM